MENGNEKQNKVLNETGFRGNKHQGQWRIVCGSDQRFYFTNSETGISQWLPPAEVWSSKLGLPYGWEEGINENNIKYYINHVNKTTTLEDPRSEADQATQLRMAAQRSRKVQVKRDPSLGFGFVAGSEKPVVIRSVILDGPSYDKLFSNDQILRVNGEDVSEVPQERVINLIKSSINVLEMHVVSSEDLQDAKNQGQRRSSLMSRATRERRRSSPVNVRFADDIVQYIGPAEQARRGSFPVLPNVLKVFLENGQTRSFHYNPKTIVQEIFTALGQKLGITSMEYFSLVLSGPQKNQLSLLQNHEKVSEIYLNRNCSRSSWVCKLRLCFLPRDPNELFEEDPVAFNYLYDQISKDIVEGLYEIDLRYDLAVKLAALHMQQKTTESKNKIPAKISVKTVEKDFDGLGHFIPENIVNGVKLKDLRKVLDQQIKFNQCLATLGQRYLTSNECKQQYLKVASDLVSYGGKYFNVILYSYDWGDNGTGNNQSRKARHQEATLLVSPRYGLSQMVKGKINVLCQLADLEQITEFSIAYHAEGKRLLTMSVTDSKDTVLLMKPLDSMDLVTFVVGYQKLWTRPVAKLRIEGETQEPLAPLTDDDIPSYATVHRIIPDSWSYPSLLQVPGYNSEHNFSVDLSRDPPIRNEKSKDISMDDIDNNNVALKRSSDDITSNEDESESLSSGVVPEKRLKSDEPNTNSNADESSNTKDADKTPRPLCMITEEGRFSPNNEDEETADDDYISQLALAEEMWREKRGQNQPTSVDEKSPSNVRTLNDKEISHSIEDVEDSEIFYKKDTVEHKTDASIMDNVDTVEVCRTDIGAMEDNEQGQVTSDIRLDESSESNIDSNNDVETGSSNTSMVDENEEFDQHTKEQFLDINDIDIDDRSSDGRPADESQTSLSDFSFAGDLFPHEVKSSTESLDQQYDAVSSAKQSIHEPEDDESMTTTLVPTVYKDATTGHEQVLSEDEGASNISRETKPDPPAPDSVLSEKKKHFSKKLNVDELGSKVFNGKMFMENHSSSEDSEEVVSSILGSKYVKRSTKMGEYNINNDDVEIDDDVSSDNEEVRLLSYNRIDDEVSARLEKVTPDRDVIEADDVVDAGGKDSSSLTSRSSWNFVCEVNTDFHEFNTDSHEVNTDSHEVNTDSHEVNTDSHEVNTDFHEFNTDSHEEDVTVDKHGEDVDSESLEQDSDSKTQLDEFAGTNESTQCSAQEYLKPNKTEDIKKLEDDIASSSDEIDDTIDDMVKTGSSDMTVKIEILNPDSDSPKIGKESSPMTLFLGDEPGESEDTPFNFQEDSSMFEMSDEQDFSLMNWIIPPPPGSTQELQDSDITVASPPPPSPGHDFISSPPVELSDKMFDEFEIDGLVVPPPPLGSSFDEVIKIVSPPPVHKKDSSKKRTIESYDHETTGVDINTKKLDNLSLSDGDERHDEVVVMEPDRHQTRRLNSSESWGSLAFEFDSDSTNYNSESMISCYSLSNDSQRTSEDELFEEQPKELLGGEIDKHFGQRVTMGLKENTREQDVKQKTVCAEETVVSQRNRQATNGNDHLKDTLQPLKVKTQNTTDIELEEIVPTVNHKRLSSSQLQIDLLNLGCEPTLHMSNGLPFDDDDYDCLDDVIVDSRNHNSLHNVEKPRLPEAESAKQNALSTKSRLNDKVPVNTVNTRGDESVGISTFDNTPSSPFDVKNRASRCNQLQNTAGKDHFPSLSSAAKYTDTNSKEVADGKSCLVFQDDKNLDDTPLRIKSSKPSESSNVTMNAILADASSEEDSNSDSLSSSFPGYLLKQSQANPARKLNNVALSEGSMEFESDSTTDEERTCTLTRPVTRKTSLSHNSSNSLNRTELLDNNDDDSGVDDSDPVSLKKLHAAKLETKVLAKRLQLRIQGCVEDCKKAVLKSSYSPYTNNAKWRDAVQENARYFVSDIKRLNSDVQEMSSNAIPSSIKASQETLQSLVSSFVMASTTHSRISLYSIRILAGILNDVICLYDDVIGKTEEAVSLYPDKKKCNIVTEKTTAMNTLVASLSRTLKRL